MYDINLTIEPQYSLHVKRLIIDKLAIEEINF